MLSLPQTYTIPLMILALLVAIIGHEIMHGYIALKFGDTTARDAGRLSLNPIVHIDLVGSILVPAALFLFNAPFLFGWAKPVPVQISRVINNGGHFGAFAVSMAGVSYNFILAILASVCISFLAITEDSGFLLVVLLFFLLQLLIYNVVLGVFNCIPIPPLDGASALAYLGLMFKSDFFAQIFNKIPPIAGMLVIMLILSLPTNLISTPIQYIIRLLL